MTLYAPAAYSASKSIIVLGDSLSAGYGLASGTGWVSLMEQRLQEEHLAATVVNASISGETTSGGKTRLPALLEKQPSIVIIELGGNDALRGLPLDATVANMRSMISAAQSSHAKVLLVGMQMPPNYGAEYTRRFATMFGDLAKEYHAAYVPFLLAGLEQKRELFQPDGIHPVAQAQTILLNNVWPTLKPLFKP